MIIKIVRPHMLSDKIFFDDEDDFFSYCYNGIKVDINDIYIKTWRCIVYFNGVQLTGHEFRVWYDAKFRDREKWWSEYRKRMFTKYFRGGSKYRRQRGTIFRHPATFSQLREVDEFVRPKRRNLPNSWDDKLRSNWDNKNWKKFRKTQYKVKGLGDKPNP